MVYADRQGFVWNSRNISGGDTIDFLRKVEGKSFPEAVEAITGETAPVACQPAPVYRSEAGKLVLPAKAEGKYDRVFAYLAETRGISPAVISDFMKSKQIYQDIKGNCVFIGFDEKGTAKFSAVRTTLTNRKYRGDCKNSDKRYAFSQIGTDTTRLYVFEAPIDLLSHCTMAAQAVLKLKPQYPHIRLILILPCVDQTAGWKQSDIDEYEHIKALADKVIYTSKAYYSGCMFKCNRHLVNNSSLCICYLTRQTGGTAYTVRYAESKGVTVLNLSKQP